MTGTGGGHEAKYNKMDFLILDILGKDNFSVEDLDSDDLEHEFGWFPGERRVQPCWEFLPFSLKLGGTCHYIHNSPPSQYKSLCKFCPQITPFLITGLRTDLILTYTQCPQYPSPSPSHLNLPSLTLLPRSKDAIQWLVTDRKMSVWNTLARWLKFAFHFVAVY